MGKLMSVLSFGQVWNDLVIVFWCSDPWRWSDIFFTYFYWSFFSVGHKQSNFNILYPLFIIMPANYGTVEETVLSTDNESSNKNSEHLKPFPCRKKPVCLKSSIFSIG